MLQPAQITHGGDRLYASGRPPLPILPEELQTLITEYDRLGDDHEKCSKRLAAIDVGGPAQDAANADADLAAIAIRTKSGDPAATPNADALAEERSGLINKRAALAKARYDCSNDITAACQEQAAAPERTASLKAAHNRVDKAAKALMAAIEDTISQQSLSDWMQGRLYARTDHINVGELFPELVHALGINATDSRAAVPVATALQRMTR